jgi:uncharacterized protein (DUF849 family)
VGSPPGPWDGRWDATMLLQAAINGSRTAADHPAVPLYPEQLAEAAVASVAAGAEAVHLHVRARDGRESLAPQDLTRALVAVREACGAVPVGISTGAWIEPDPARRLAAIRSWRARPDFASVNFHETGAAELAEALLDLGVAVEAGLATPTGAEWLVEAGLETQCLRILIEPQERELPAALDTVAAIERILDHPAPSTTRLLHGTEATAWPLLAEAARRGYDMRIGLEDTLRMPEGGTAADNAELVRAARPYRAAWTSG